MQALYAELIGTARRRVEAAIATGNADEVIRLLGLGEDQADATFGALLESLRNVFILGGVAQAARLNPRGATPVRCAGHCGPSKIYGFDSMRVTSGAIEYLRQNDQGFAEADLVRDGTRKSAAGNGRRRAARLDARSDCPTYAAAGANRDSGRIVGQGAAGTRRPFDTAERGLSAAQGT